MKTVSSTTGVAEVNEMEYSECSALLSVLHTLADICQKEQCLHLSGALWWTVMHVDVLPGLEVVLMKMMTKYKKSN